MTLSEISGTIPFHRWGGWGQGLSHNKEISTHFTKSQLLPAAMTVLCSRMELEVDWSPVLGTLTPSSVMASDVAGLCRHRMGCSDGGPQPRLPLLGNHYPLHYYSYTVGLWPEINLKGPRCGSPYVNCAGRATFRPSGTAVAGLGAPQMLSSSMCAYATSS